MNYFKKPFGPDVVVEVRKNGALMTVPNLESRCGEKLDVNAAIEAEAGGKMAPRAKLLIEKAEGVKKWNALKDAVDDDKIFLEDVFKKSTKLLFKPDAEARGAREFAFSFDLVCPKCLVMEGKIGVALRLADAVEPFEITKADLMRLKASPEMMAYASKRMNFSGVAQMEEYLSDMDSEKGKAVLQSAIDGLRELKLPYEVTYITATLRSQMSEIDAEVKRRKVEFVNAVERIVEERTQIIT
jgi:hypothetical protein